MWALRIVVLGGALVAASAAKAVPTFSPLAPTAGALFEPVQAFCGPFRCFARPFWRYRSGAGFRPYRGFALAPPRARFAPFGFRRYGGYGRFGGIRRF